MKPLSLLVVTGFLLASLGCARSPDLAAEKVQVQAVIEGFRQAWETSDSGRFAAVVAHDADMVVFGTDAAEHWVGWSPLEASVREMLGVISKTRITVREQSIKVHASGRVAWFAQVWDWDYEVAGNPVHGPGQRFTGVLEKRGERWVIVQFHNSVPVGG